jgi:hypothetical protein
MFHLTSTGRVQLPEQEVRKGPPSNHYRSMQIYFNSDPDDNTDATDAIQCILDQGWRICVLGLTNCAYVDSSRLYLPHLTDLILDDLVCWPVLENFAQVTTVVIRGGVMPAKDKYKGHKGASLFPLLTCLALCNVAGCTNVEDLIGVTAWRNVKSLWLHNMPDMQMGMIPPRATSVHIRLCANMMIIVCCLSNRLLYLRKMVVTACAKLTNIQVHNCASLETMYLVQLPVLQALSWPRLLPGNTYSALRELSCCDSAVQCLHTCPSDGLTNLSIVRPRGQQRDMQVIMHLLTQTGKLNRLQLQCPGVPDLPLLCVLRVLNENLVELDLGSQASQLAQAKPNFRISQKLSGSGAWQGAKWKSLSPNQISRCH